MSRFLPVGKGVKGAAGFLLAAIPALGTVLAGLAITGGLVGHMARDHPLATYGAFGLTVLALFAGAVAAFALREGSTGERLAIYAGLALVGTSLLLGVYAGVQTWGDRVQPSITLTPLPGQRVAVSVRGNGLRSSEHILVEVEQLVRAKSDQGRLTWKPGEPLYGASLGPDGDGQIAYTIEIPLPQGDYDDLGARAWVGAEPRPCYSRGNTTGCVRIHVPRQQERPQLAVSWETYVRVPRLLVHLSARNLAQRPARSMTLRVFGIAAAPPRRMLAEWQLAPSETGSFDRRLAVVVGRAYTDVCVVASTTTLDPPCPAPEGAGTVWSRLAVPPAA
jgi:hypothetical protein